MHRNHAQRSKICIITIIIIMVIITSCSLLYLGREANASPLTQVLLSQKIILFAPNTSNIKYPSECLGHRGEWFSLAFSPLSQYPRFWPTAVSAWWQIQECLCRFSSLHMFWKQARRVLKQGKRESKTVERSKTGLPLPTGKPQRSCHSPPKPGALCVFSSSEFKLSAQGVWPGKEIRQMGKTEDESSVEGRIPVYKRSPLDVLI